MRFSALLVLGITLGCGTTPQTQSPAMASPPSAPSAPSPAVAPAPASTPVAAPSPPTGLVNPHQEENDEIAAAVLRRIEGHENEPAEQVFKNIQSLKGMPAGRLVRVMNMGYSRALGVACSHCHFTQDYSSDEQRPKRAVREMMAMNKMINERLRTLQNLEGKPEDKYVSCTTCHRGHVDPNAGLH